MAQAQIPLLNGVTPAAPSGYQNARWQQGPSTGNDPEYDVPLIPDSCYVPNVGTAVVKTASYTATIADMGTLLVFNSASALTLTLPNPVPLNALVPSTTETRWNVSVQNIGAGLLTISRNGLMIDGAATNLPLNQNSGMVIYTDGTNYFTERGVSAPAVTLKTNGTTNSSQALLNLVAGTNVTLSESGGAVTIAASGGGGGGGGFGPPISPTPPPAISSFTWVNQGSATATNPPGSSAIAIVAPTGGINYRMLVKASPATPYSIDAYFIFNLFCSNNQTGGLIFRESSSGKFTSFYIVNGPSFPGWLGIDQNSNPNTPVTNLLRVPFATGSSSLFLRIGDDGTNRNYSVSTDGVNYTIVYTEVRTAYITADQIGFHAKSEGGSIQAVVTLSSWLQH
jgi:hypothetical protein